MRRQHCDRLVNCIFVANDGRKWEQNSLANKENNIKTQLYFTYIEHITNHRGKFH